jgi:hypothetical protein
MARPPNFCLPQWGVILRSSIRLIKRGIEESQSLDIGREAKRTNRKNTRELVNTVKGWIAELEQRHRSEERRAAAFLK